MLRKTRFRTTAVTGDSDLQGRNPTQCGSRQARTRSHTADIRRSEADQVVSRLGWGGVGA